MRLGLSFIWQLSPLSFSLSHLKNNVRKFEVANYTPSYYGFGASWEMECVTGYQSIPELRLHLALPVCGLPNPSHTEQTYLPFTTLSSLGNKPHA